MGNGILDVAFSKPCAKSYAETAASLQRDGFAVARGCVDGDALRELVDEYETTILPHKYSSDVRREKNGVPGKDGLARVVHVANVHELPKLANLAADRRLLGLASACLGGVGVRPIVNTELFDKPPLGNESTKTSPHQDNYYFQASEPGVALWIALDEVSSNSGTVRYVHGSHLRGLRFHDWDWGPCGGFAKMIDDYTDEDDELERDVGHLCVGDVVVHHGLTIHHASANWTESRRRGLVVNYVADHVACSLADDLYQPALNFHVNETGSFVAAVRAGWSERQVLAATSVECALAGWRGVEGGIQSIIKIDGNIGKLYVEIPDHHLRRQAVLALVESGHVFHGVGIVSSMPLRLESFEIPNPPMTFSGTRLPEAYLGVWKLISKGLSGTTETNELAVRLQTLSGVFVEICIPRSIIDASSVTVDSCRELLMLLASQRSSVGMLSVHGANLDTVVRHRCFGFDPFNGIADVGRVHWRGNGDKDWVETSMHRHRRDYEETWRRVDELFELDNVVVLELMADELGRLGVWVVMGTWFARVVGRRAGDTIKDVVCKSLTHAIKTYAEDWGMDPEAAVYGYEATLGRVEAPGVFRIMHDFDPVREGSLLLDGCCRQLRRDSDDDHVLVEPWSMQRWKIRELPQEFAPFGKLKREITRP
mmetsp:Transcript_1404/g.3132  ORF Transcript_1404/g.3132 Transcript_1404/m.3132 type:complete len:653 (+) Transcript_1404:38-1996(+)